MQARAASKPVGESLSLTVERRELLDRMFTLVCIFSPDGVLLEANQAAFDAAGLQPADVIGERYDAIDPLSHSPEVTAQVADMLRRSVLGETVRAELCVRLAHGRLAIMDCMSSPMRDREGRVVQIVGTGVEITQRREAESALLRLNRELRMLTSCNQRLVRAPEESELLKDICKIIVEVGGYRLAWVGFARHDAQRSVRAVAHAGLDSAYLERTQISWGDSAHGRGPTGRAIREQALQICHDLEEDPSFLPWIEEARLRGYASSIALPLLIGEERGALNIYSERPRAFDDAEVALLSELAHDLAYGIGALRAHVERERQQREIARLTRVLRMQSAVNAAVLRIRDRNELLQEACRITTHVGGYDRAVVSLVDADGRRARPCFRDGAAEDFPEPAELILSEHHEADTSLTSRALRTGEVTVCSDLTQSEPPVAMREKLIELGYRSVVVLPLLAEGRRFGALTLTSRHVDLVREEELLLLQDMAVSLSFALRLQEQAQTAEFLAFYDPLTGLARRAVFCQRIDQLLQARAGPGENPAIAAFDVHDLNSINDAFGRRFGDLLLQEVAVRLKRHAASEQHIGYLGGGTFVMSEPQLISADETIASLLDSIVFADPFVIEGRTLRVSCRSGVARYPADGTTAETLVGNAEAALLRAKSTGEQYVHFDLEMRNKVAERLALEHRLRTAIDEQQFELYYQPQLNITSGRIESLEALLRWNDPENGLVTPARFLPVLESSGMILNVGKWVLTRAVKDCRRWSDLRLGPVRVAVNVSALQIRQSGFVAFVADLVRRELADRPGYGIDLEITETSLLQDLDSARRKLDELRALGVRVALDDFGTGYSSLGLLSTLPVDLLKIDRSFVKGLPHEPTSETLVGSIIRLAGSFGLITVAEGVESMPQLDALRAMHCDQSQGYLHCAPVSADRIEKLLALGLAPPT
jgi:diguanylate cyclase (GGDEF)-like protein/PAS domain S-box-containing protein